MISYRTPFLTKIRAFLICSVLCAAGFALVYLPVYAEEGPGVAVCTGTSADTSTTTTEVRTRCLDYVLSGGLLDLMFTGTSGNFKGTGNARANTVTGGPGDDTLFGGGGNDTLITGASTSATGDKLTGGSGNDRFVISEGNTVAVVSDFISGTDKIDVRAMGFTSLSQLQSTAVQSSATQVSITSTLGAVPMQLKLNQFSLSQLSNGNDFVFADSGTGSSTDTTVPTVSGLSPAGTLA